MPTRKQIERAVATSSYERAVIAAVDARPRAAPEAPSPPAAPDPDPDAIRSIPARHASRVDRP